MINNGMNMIKEPKKKKIRNSIIKTFFLIFIFVLAKKNSLEEGSIKRLNLLKLMLIFQCPKPKSLFFFITAHHITIFFMTNLLYTERRNKKKKRVRPILGCLIIKLICLLYFSFFFLDKTSVSPSLSPPTRSLCFFFNLTQLKK